MKKIVAAAALASVTLLSGCAVTPFQSGLLYSQQTMPVDSPNNGKCSKVGKGTSTNVLGLFAFGNAGIANAKKDAGITKVDSVDIFHTGILGIFGTTTVEVCGE